MAATLTGNVFDAIGDEALTGATLTIALLTPFATAANSYPRNSEAVTIAGDGSFTVDLATPDSGSAHYHLTVDSAAGTRLLTLRFYVSAADDGETIQLETLLADPPSYGGAPSSGVHVTADMYDALDAANAPSGANAVATVADLIGSVPTAFAGLLLKGGPFPLAANTLHTVDIGGGWSVHSSAAGGERIGDLATLINGGKYKAPTSGVYEVGFQLFFPSLIPLIPILQSGQQVFVYLYYKVGGVDRGRASVIADYHVAGSASGLEWPASSWHVNRMLPLTAGEELELRIRPSFATLKPYGSLTQLQAWLQIKRVE